MDCFEDITQQSDLIIFDEKTGEKRILPKYEILNSFMLASKDFYLIERNEKYFICIINDGDLYSLWQHPKKDFQDTYLPSEIISLFRRKYLLNDIKQEDINLFLSNPKKYVKLFKKKKSGK